MPVNQIPSCLIIGCGRIAGGFDALRSPEQMPLSHAGAFTRHGRYRILACVEPMPSRRAEFMHRWAVPEGYADVAELASHTGRYDVISVCSPTNEHYCSVKVAIALSPRLIFCEKPLTPQLSQASELVEACRLAGILLAVNYTRRWDEDVVQLAADLKSGVWGAVRSVTGVYTKGILNNGSHMVDLLHLLFGPLEVRGVGEPIYDGFPDDPSVAVTLATNDHIPVQLSCADARDYSMFELQIVTEKGVITMEDGGLDWRIRRVVESPNFLSYRSLDAGVRKAGRLPGATLAAVSEIYAALTSDRPISSSGDNALRAQQVCEAIRDRAIRRD